MFFIEYVHLDYSERLKTLHFQVSLIVVGPCVLYRMCSLSNVFSIECVLYRMCSLSNVFSIHVLSIQCVLFDD